MSKYAPHRTSSTNPRATSSTVCQKCYGKGHFIYECKSTRPYLSRPSRTKQLENPRLLAKLRAEGKPSVEVPEEFKKQSGTADKILEAKEKQRAIEQGNEKTSSKTTGKRKRSGSSSSSSETGSSSGSSSDSDSGSDSDSSSGSDSSSSSGGSRGRHRKRSAHRKHSPSRSASLSDDGSQRSRRR